MKRIIAALVISMLAQGLIAQDVPDKRAHHSIVYDSGLKTVIMTAGSTPLNGGESFRFFNDVWSYSGSGWKRMATAGDERSGISLAYDAKRNKVFSYGGYINGSSKGELRVLNGSAWATLSDAPEMRAAEGVLVYDSDRDRLIAFGGSAGRGSVNGTTWEWDGNAWKKFEGPGPEGRQAFAMVYDSKRKRTVLFGGMGSGAPGQRYPETWEFDGMKWTKVASTGPEPRMSPGYAYDSKRGLFLIFGGFASSGAKNDLWGWDGREWKKLADGGPPARAMGYMAYDIARDKVVLFGGRFGWPNDANDTWEWNGRVWTEVK